MLESFTPESPFVTEDNRRLRPLLPTTAETLNARHSRLMPARVVRGRSLLDLGCCIGATGQWALAHGASSYTGVEHQKLYVRQAKGLLSEWRRAQVIAEDATRFAARTRRRWHVVALLGVAHGLYDPLALIRDAAALATEYVCFEDFGQPVDAPALLCGRTAMPIAGEFAGTRGFGWQFNPAAMQLILQCLGFEPDMKPWFVMESRWLCRYRRVGKPQPSAAYAKEKRAWKP